MELSDEQTHEMIRTRDIIRCWGRRGMGDFAVGVRAKTDDKAEAVYQKGRALGDESQGIWIYEGSLYNELVGSDVQPLESITWAGYAGVRDATTTSIPIQEGEGAPTEPWEEMIELRYGVGLDHWGQGIAKEAAEAVMQWAVSDKGARRFIAETEKGNTRSGRVLQKMGFSLSGTDYWKEPSELEWERIPQ
ncbi:hypothetical protein QQX98_004953 [Neonectria punicea]|uniref:N-acetyltransferase domain-containing protein n=1 Tax=Neonectria punicea TaxID=979145 RepID=A0ABR1H723_9HYPO